MKPLKFLLALTTKIIFLVVFCPAVFPQDLQRTIAAAISKDDYVKNQLTVVFCDGPVFFNHREQKSWIPITKGQTLIDGDAIRTGPNGYLVLAYSTDNLLLIKPRSGMRFAISEDRIPHVTADIYEATVLLSAREMKGINLVSSKGTLYLEKGEASFQSTKKLDTVKALQGTAYFRLTGSTEPHEVLEGTMMEVDERGYETGLTSVDTRMEYDSFRRFNTYLRNFDEVNRDTSTEITYRVDSVILNGKYLSHLEVDPQGYRIIDPGGQATPKAIHLRLKITPYPRPSDRFELYITKDLVYALREGSDGFFEVRFPVPAFPEFFVKVHFLDSQGRRDRIFESRFVFFNKRRKIEEIKTFLKQLSLAFTRRDTVFLRDHISRNYHDWFGNTYFDFAKLIDDTLRQYRDVRLVLHPHTFIFQKDLVKVNLNYRFSALTGNWNYRYEDLGSDLMTLVYEDNELHIQSKSRGIFLQRTKVTVDPRRGILKGRVMDEASKMPLSGALVRILRTNFKTFTDRFGEYVIYNIPPGKYDLEISKNGYGKTTIVQVSILPSREKY